MDFKAYGLAQMVAGNEAKFRAFVALAMDTVATVQNWEGAEKRKSRAECEAALSMALTLARTPETTARRVLATVHGLVTRFGTDYRQTLASIRAAVVAEGTNATPESVVSDMVAVLQAEGADNLGLLEAYARGGKPGLAGERAKVATRIQEAEARAAMTEAEAKEAAETEAAVAAEAAADKSPAAKAAKAGAAVLDALAKHGPMMDMAVLQAIASAVAEQVAARLSVADDKRAADLAAAATARAEAAAEAKAERLAKAAKVAKAA